MKKKIGIKKKTPAAKRKGVNQVLVDHGTGLSNWERQTIMKLSAMVEKAIDKGIDEEDISAYHLASALSDFIDYCGRYWYDILNIKDMDVFATGYDKDGNPTGMASYSLDTPAGFYKAIADYLQHKAADEENQSKMTHRVNAEGDHWGHLCEIVLTKRGKKAIRCECGETLLIPVRFALPRN